MKQEVNREYERLREAARKQIEDQLDKFAD